MSYSLNFWHFRFLMTSISRKIHRKTGSHNDSKIYLAMLKRVESKKCTLFIRHHYEAVLKSILMHHYGFLASSSDCANMDSVEDICGYFPCAPFPRLERGKVVWVLSFDLPWVRINIAFRYSYAMSVLRHFIDKIK